MQNPAPCVLDYKQAIQNAEAHRRNGEEIQPRWPRGDSAGKPASAFRDLRVAGPREGTEIRIVPRARSRVLAAPRGFWARPGWILSPHAPDEFLDSRGDFWPCRRPDHETANASTAGIRHDAIPPQFPASRSAAPRPGAARRRVASSRTAGLSRSVLDAAACVSEPRLDDARLESPEPDRLDR